MDPQLLQHGREVAGLLNRRVLITIPSVLAGGEMFAARVSVLGADSLPDERFEGEIALGESCGIEGLGASVHLGPGDGGAARVEGLRAVGPRFAQVVGQCGGLAVRSNPAWVFDQPAWRVYWGDLHIHTKYSNCMEWSCRDPEFGYAFARDVTHLDFAAAADHLRGIAWAADRWPRLCELVRQYDQPGAFVPFLAFESSHKAGYGGDNNAYYLGLVDAPYFWPDREDMKGAGPAVRLEAMWEFLEATGREFFTVPHHTGRAGKYRRFDEPVHNPAREPLFEIYSAWGSSEKRISDFPLHAGNTDHASYFVDAIRAGCRYGVIASSDDHTTLPGAPSRNWGVPLGPPALSGYHHMGLAGVRAKELTREALWDAMTARQTYATTFARSLVDVQLGELEMGQAADVDASDPMRARRRFDVRLSLADGKSGTVTLVRNGEDLVSQRVPSDPPVTEITLEDAEPLDAVAIRGAAFHPEPFVAYYLRVQTGSKDTQWTSPIWLDL